MKTLTTLTAAVAVTATVAFPAFADDAKGRVLLVASSENILALSDGRQHQTGYYLGELAVPAQAFIAAGYEVVVATPDGNTPALDGNSINLDLFHNDRDAMDQALRFVTTDPSMQKPQVLAKVVQAGLDDFDALYVPGGHAPMTDLMQDRDLGAALRHFHDAGKVTAMLCHGPIAFSAAVENPEDFRAAMVAGDLARASELAGDWPYAGYNMTVYSTAEEKGVEDWLGAEIEFYMEDALRAAGATVTVAEPDQPYVVVDRELVTGQNPWSDAALAEAVITALDRQVAERTGQ
ncbi:MAG: type 1 glutamine amidotransferase domain-containing protein [Paracoccus sp. (in: a-proteobacteria)]|uniref:type 1 glutamine amidotransferase domain-containing protein n=1 Tax=Paracoccus sp. TaxID=267 RepID=UPI0026E03576|nr:type 1 glutamine amidotransferase domain-containing protein [Paracoccus sp. (in: a-proteobacteria)]MDO5632388.1 type 1 glutamine amidotransferase domain-containing protein [Paracoccus sp. (in: a-proteobacteria)]